MKHCSNSAVLTALSQQLTGAILITNQAKKLYARAFEHETALRKAQVKAQIEHNKAINNKGD